MPKGLYTAGHVITVVTDRCQNANLTPRRSSSGSSSGGLFLQLLPACNNITTILQQCPQCHCPNVYFAALTT